MDQNGKPVVVIRENAFEAYPQNVHDMTVATRKGSVKVWFGRADIGLDLSFSRLTMERLEQKLAEDRCRGADQMLKSLRERPSNMPDDHRQRIEDDMHKLKEGKANDRVGPAVTEWVRGKCVDGEGKIPFLDFEQFSAYSQGKRITIRDGVGSIKYCAGFNDAGTAFNLDV